MSDQVVSQADIIRAFGKMLKERNLVKKGMMEHENEWGMDVIYHKQQAGLMMFIWVTPDLLHIELPFDMFELKKKGKLYIDERYEIIRDQLAAARAERQREQSIIIHNSTPHVDKAPPVKKPLADGIKTAVAGNETVH